MQLSSKTVAQIALFMYQKYQEAMQPPVFAIIPFEDWLQTIIDKEQQ